MAFDSTEVAWRDMSIFLSGVRVGKIRKLKYKTIRETEHLYGAGDDPFDINPGNKSYEGEMEVYKSVVDEMNIAARAAGFEDLTDIPWVITVHYKATATQPQQTVTLPAVRFSEFESGMENNNKFMLINMPFRSLRPVVG